MSINNNRPFTVGPASPLVNASNYRSFDYFDLDDIFSEDFFPVELEFPILGLEENSTNSGHLPSSSSSSLSSSSSSSSIVMHDKNKSNDTKVIMIPPQMPFQQLEYRQPLKVERVPENTVTVKTETEFDQSNTTQKRRAVRDIGENEDESKVERRERNREHAKRSRIRKRLLLDSLQDQLTATRNENIKLRRVVSSKLPLDIAQKVLMECTTEESNLLQGESQQEDGGKITTGDIHAVTNSNSKPSRLTYNISNNQILLTNSIEQLNQINVAANMLSSGKLEGKTTETKRRLLMEPDYRLIESLVTSQQNFVLSDPSLPDNPIVYCSDGFCQLSGYKRSEVIGRNCRFLQGPGTDQAAVEIIRKGVEEGRDISVCLLNYKADATPFWNQFFVAPIKDDAGQVVNYVGVQCEVNTMPISGIKERVKKLPIPTDSFTIKQLNEASALR